MHRFLVVMEIESVARLTFLRKSMWAERSVSGVAENRVSGSGAESGCHNHGLCGSNKLLYKRCAFSMGGAKFRPPQLPHFSSDLSETQKTKKRIRDTNRHAKFGKDRFTGGVWATTQILAVHSGLPFIYIFCCILRSASRSHRASYGDRWGLKRRVSGQWSAFWGS